MVGRVSGFFERTPNSIRLERIAFENMSTQSRPVELLIFVIMLLHMSCACVHLPAS
jgi:hypothetical protein